MTDQWQLHAECRGADTELFYSEQRADQQDTITAYCTPCPVRAVCLARAERWGIWGGTTALERARRRGRRKVGA